MKPITFFLTLLCGALLCIATANAGIERLSASKEMPAAPLPEFSWTGFYIGGNLGGMWSDFNYSSFDEVVDVDEQFFENTVDPFSPDGGVAGGMGAFIFESESFTFGGGSNGSTGIHGGSDDSFIGGGQLGYRHQFGHFVIGIEGDFDRASANRSISFSETRQQFVPLSTTDGPGLFIENLEADTTLNVRRETQMEWQGSARGVLGWANGHVLLYVTGGAAFADVTSRAVDSATTTFFDNQLFPAISIPFSGTAGVFPPIGSLSHIPIGTASDTNVSENDDILTGWTGGGGGEYALNDMFSIGMEYRHTDLGNHTFHYSSHGGNIIPGPTKVDIENDQVVVKFNILLNSFFGH
jgi:outer membrane immunogenic protein